MAIYTAPGGAGTSTSPGWKAESYIFDKTLNQVWDTLPFDVNLYMTLTIPTAIVWHATPGGGYTLADTTPTTFTYSSNALTGYTIYGTTPTSQFGDTFDVSNIFIGTSTVSETGAQAFSGATTPWLSGLANGSGLTTATGWWVSVPTDTPTGTYVFNYYIGIAQTGYASLT